MIFDDLDLKTFKFKLELILLKGLLLKVAIRVFFVQNLLIKYHMFTEILFKI